MRGARTTRPPRPQTAAERWFKAGSDLARVGRYSEALAPLEQALAYSVEQPNEPILRAIRSFYGLAIAMGRGELARGRGLCEEAVLEGPGSAELLINLSQVYVRGGRKDLAVDALRTALALAPSDERAQLLRAQLGVRRQPVFPFLSRRNPLNRVAGRLRHRVLPLTVS